MASTTTTHTTAEEHATPSDSGAALQTALLWVHPQSLLTPLDAASISFGRGDECDAVLPGSVISRVHARIIRNGPLRILRDEGSRNGCCHNGTLTREAPLERGDVIRLGEWVGVVASVPSGTTSGGLRSLARGLRAGPWMAQRLEPLRRAAASDLPVLLVGPTGVGKEVLARAVHEWSGRRGEFVGVNCAALPEGLAEAELFGFRKGAFTGATTDASGKLRAASDGTLLLDELADLPLQIQAKLLRVLEERAVVPLGTTRSIPTDVRLIAACQVPLGEAIREQRFRADLYARLAGLVFEVPTLAERRDEVVPLFASMLTQKSAGRPPLLHERFAEALCLYDWPGNVRELAQLCHQVAVLHGHVETLRVSHLPLSVREALACSGETTVQDASSVAAVDPGAARQQRASQDLAALMMALRGNGGNVSQAARSVGISRNRAYRLMSAQAAGKAPASKTEAPNGQGSVDS